MMWENPTQMPLDRVRHCLKEKKAVWPTHPVTEVEGDATTTGQGAGEPKPH